MMTHMKPQQASARQPRPWATFALISLCFGVFLASDTSLPESESSVTATLEAASSYWRQHAYLEPDPKVQTHASAGVPERRRRLVIEAMRELAERRSNTDAVARSKEQATLDQLTQAALAPAPATGSA